MQRGFTKLFNTIVTSTIWQEDDKTRIVWITMLAIADAFGNVFAAIPGLASVANVTIEAAQKAVDNLLAPDEWSRTKDFEGRRIEAIDGGWHILNYGKYRKMMDEEERREYKAKWARESRQKKSKTVKDSHRQTGTNVDKSGLEGTESRPCGHIPSASASSSFWEELKRNPLYTGIDIDAEVEKAKRWCSRKNRKLTQRFFKNWLEKADRELPIPVAIKTIAKPMSPDDEEWQKRWKENHGRKATG